MTKALIDTLKDYDVEPYFFGLGFIQCKLNKEQRIHFYHPELKPTVNYEEELHNHRYDFLSTVLAGEINNRIYIFTEHSEGDYFLHEESCNPNIIPPASNPLRGKVEKFFDKNYTQNESYFMDHNTFHTVYSTYAITHLKRTEYKKVTSHVLRKENEEKICPFEKKLDTNKCWEIIYDCIQIAKTDV